MHSLRPTTRRLRAYLSRHPRPAGRRVAVYLGTIGPLDAQHATGLETRLRHELTGRGLDVAAILWDVGGDVPLEDRPGLMTAIRMKAAGDVDEVLTDTDYLLSPAAHRWRSAVAHWLNPEIKTR